MYITIDSNDSNEGALSSRVALPNRNSIATVTHPSSRFVQILDSKSTSVNPTDDAAATDPAAVAQLAEVDVLSRYIHASEIIDAAQWVSCRKRASPSLVFLFAHTKHSQNAGPCSVTRLKMDLPFHNRLASTGEVPAL